MNSIGATGPKQDQSRTKESAINQAGYGFCGKLQDAPIRKLVSHSALGSRPIDRYRRSPASDFWLHLLACAELGELAVEPKGRTGGTRDGKKGGIFFAIRIRTTDHAPAAESNDARQKGLNEQQIAAFCQDHRAVINRLCALPDGITIDEDQDFLPVVVDASFFFRLLVLDATIEMRKGDPANAQRSFDAAYRVLGHMQQAPGLVPLLGSMGLRQAVIEMISQPFAAPLGSLFRESYPMSADTFESAVKSQYHLSKNLFQDAMTGSTPMEQNLLRLVLGRHLENFQSIHEENPADLRPDPIAVAGDLIFRQRKCFFPEHRTTYEAGYQLSQAITEATATITAAVAFPNATRIDTGVQSVTAAEQAIVEGWLAATAVGTDQAH